MNQPHTFVPIAPLTAPSTAIVDEPRLESAGGRLTLRWRFDRETRVLASGLQFEGASDFRHGTESHSTSWHLAGYDHLVQVSPSEWLEEAKEIEVARGYGGWEIKHYLIYLDSWGYLEVLARSWSFLDEVYV